MTPVLTPVLTPVMTSRKAAVAANGGSVGQRRRQRVDATHHLRR